MSRMEQIGDCTLYLGDCREILPTLGKVDAVVTDPPYPSWHTETYRFDPEAIKILDAVECHQFIFWTASSPFPLPYSGKRIWEKCVGTLTQFEEIYERNRGSGYQIHRYMSPHSSVRAKIGNDVCVEHQSQKPVHLIIRLLRDMTGGVVLDPFMGSGTTGVACVKLGRKFIGIEVEERYFSIACRRIADAVSRPDMFIEAEKQERQPSFLDEAAA